ncbi:hypothetical protein [Lacipirellula parvula]|uniref:Uncharacterized protein n=1 Tax=Lacipirellula parvula TaxID=2650471 RepID=A0A5K7XB46_9BACT|nr:hypothetical protein [Lacipirellula parvula]BBO33994.1 hypothetical protein PLANPX_3606 [Lacipirellula parvula]
MADSEPESESSSGKPVGIGVLVVILLIGAKAFFRAQPHLEKAEQKRAASQARADAAAALTKPDLDAYLEQQEDYNAVADLQREFQLSDEEFEDVLRTAWSSNHPDAAMNPWQIRIGNISDPYWWRAQQKWELEEIRNACQRRTAAVDSAVDATATPAAPEQN